MATRVFYDVQHQTLVLYIPTKHCVSYDANGQGKEKDIGGEIVECIFDFEREKCLLRSSLGEKELLLDRHAGIRFLNPDTGETEKLDFPYLQEELRHLQHTLLYGEKTQRYAQEFQNVASALNLLPENTFEEDLFFLTQQEGYQAGKDYSALFSPSWNIPLHVWRDYRQNMGFAEEFGAFSYHAPTDTLTLYTDDGNEITLDLSSPNLYGAEINGDLMSITSQDEKDIASTEMLSLKVGDLLDNGLTGKTSLRAAILDENAEALKNLPQVLESLAKERGVLHPVKKQDAFSRFNDAINEKLAGEKFEYEEAQRAERARLHEEQRLEAKAHLFDEPPYQEEKESQPIRDSEDERKALFQLQNSAARKIFEQQKKKVTVMDDEPLISEERAQAIMQRVKNEASTPVWEAGMYDEAMDMILPAKPFKTTFHWTQKDGQIFCLHNQIASKSNEGFSRYVYDWNNEIKNGTRKDAPLKLGDEVSYLTYVMNQASGKNNPKGWEEPVAVDSDKVFLVIRNNAGQVAKFSPYEFFQKQNALENGKETTDAYSREIFEYGRQHRKKNYTDVEKVPQQAQGQSDKDFAKIMEAYDHRMFFWNGLSEKERPAYEEAVQKEDWNTIKAIEEKRFEKGKVDAPNMTTAKSISPGMKAARELVEEKGMSLDTLEYLAFKHMPEMAFTKAKQAVLGEWVKPYNFFVKDTIKREMAEQKALEAKKAGTRGFDKEVKKTFFYSRLAIIKNIFGELKKMDEKKDMDFLFMSYDKLKAWVQSTDLKMPPESEREYERHKNIWEHLYTEEDRRAFVDALANGKNITDIQRIAFPEDYERDVEKEPDMRDGIKVFKAYQDRKATFGYLHAMARANPTDANQDELNSFVLHMRNGDVERVQPAVSAFLRSYDSVEEKPYIQSYQVQIPRGHGDYDVRTDKEAYTKDLKAYETRKATWDALQKKDLERVGHIATAEDYMRRQALQLRRLQGFFPYHSEEVARQAIYQNQPKNILTTIAIVSPDSFTADHLVENGANLLLILQCDRKDGRWMSSMDVERGTHSKNPNQHIEIRKGAKPLYLFTDKGIEGFYNLEDLKGPAIERIPKLPSMDENTPTVSSWKFQKALHEIVEKTPNEMLANPLQAAKVAGLNVLLQEKKRLAELNKQYSQEIQKVRGEYDRRMEIIKNDDAYMVFPKTAEEKVLSSLHIWQKIVQKKESYLFTKNFVSLAAKELLDNGMREDDLKRALDKYAPQVVFDEARRKIFGKNSKSASEATIIAAKAYRDYCTKGFMESKREYIALRKKLSSVVEKAQGHGVASAQEEKYTDQDLVDMFLKAYQQAQAKNVQLKSQGKEGLSPLFEASKVLWKEGQDRGDILNIACRCAPEALEEARKKIFGKAYCMSFMDFVIDRACKEARKELAQEEAQAKEQAKKKSQGFSR